jgi:Phage protein (N4 Gp49/phage Sf6 gene 66) family
MATKLSLEDIKNAVAEIDFLRVPDSTVTICVLRLQNGFIVLGHSACINPADFDQSLGENIAYEKALDQIWQLEGYRRMSEG